MQKEKQEQQLLIQKVASNLRDPIISDLNSITMMTSSCAFSPLSLEVINKLREIILSIPSLHSNYLEECISDLLQAEAELKLIFDDSEETDVEVTISDTLEVISFLSFIAKSFQAFAISLGDDSNADKFIYFETKLGKDLNIPTKSITNIEVGDLVEAPVVGFKGDVWGSSSRDELIIVTKVERQEAGIWIEFDNELHDRAFKYGESTDVFIIVSR